MEEKFALKDISESTTFKLSPLGIRVRLLELGEGVTDFAGKSLDVTSSESARGCNEMLNRVVQSMCNVSGYSTEGQIAEVFWEAATDGKDAKEIVTRRKNGTEEEHLEYTKRKHKVPGTSS